MDAITTLYVVNAMLLLLHEIESAYEKEWEILKLPGGITGFLLIHIPIILLMFYGLLEIENKSVTGLALGVVFGIGGVIPLIVHKIAVKREDCFNRLISSVIIYINTAVGAGLALLAGRLL